MLILCRKTSSQKMKLRQLNEQNKDNFEYDNNFENQNQNNNTTLVLRKRNKIANVFVGSEYFKKLDSMKRKCSLINNLFLFTYNITN